MRLSLMHELAICRGLLSQVEEVAREKNAERVVSVMLRIGPLAGVEPTLLQDAFGLAAAGTVAAGAQLLIERPAVVLECLECGARTTAHDNRLICQSCGCWRTRVMEGEEMLLTRVEMEL